MRIGTGVSSIRRTKDKSWCSSATESWEKEEGEEEKKGEEEDEKKYMNPKSYNDVINIFVNNFSFVQISLLFLFVTPLCTPHIHQ